MKKRYTVDLSSAEEEEEDDDHHQDFGPKKKPVSLWAMIAMAIIEINHNLIDKDTPYGAPVHKIEEYIERVFRVEKDGILDEIEKRVAENFLTYNEKKKKYELNWRSNKQASVDKKVASSSKKQKKSSKKAIIIADSDEDTKEYDDDFEQKPFSKISKSSEKPTNNKKNNSTKKHKKTKNEVLPGKNLDLYFKKNPLEISPEKKKGSDEEWAELDSHYSEITSSGKEKSSVIVDEPHKRRNTTSIAETSTNSPNKRNIRSKKPSLIDLRNVTTDDIIDEEGWASWTDIYFDISILE